MYFCQSASSMQVGSSSSRPRSTSLTRSQSQRLGDDIELGVNHKDWVIIFYYRSQLQRLDDYIIL